MSFSNTDEEILPADAPESVASDVSSPGFSGADSRGVPASEEMPPDLYAFLHTPRRNGLSLAAALALAERVADVPAVDLVWENPPEDSFNVRERKLRVAEDLGIRFPKTCGALSRAAGAITATKWSQVWQDSAERALLELSQSAGLLGEASVNFAVATGLIPVGGTIRSIANLQKLVGALLAARGEEAYLVLEKTGDSTLVRLREAASLVENCARHKSLLSLPYPEDAPENPSLESWLKLWNEAAFSGAFPRWMKRRKVVAALRRLAGCSTRSPLDPRVDLGNLIAIRVCRADFSEKFSDLTKAFPRLFPGMEPCGALDRVAVLEKARRAADAALTRLESVPEKREAWKTVFERWLGGGDPAFAASGIVEHVFEETGKALAAYEAAKATTEEVFGESISERWGETPDSVRAFSEELLADKPLWREVCSWNAVEIAAARRGMGALAEAVRTEALPASEARSVFDAAYCRRWAEALLGAEENASFAAMLKSRIPIGENVPAVADVSCPPSDSP